MNLIEKILPYDVWSISGDFGRIKADKLTHSTKEFELKCDYTRDENNVYHISGELKNISDRKITLNCLKMKFRLGGGEFDVYTQYNGWQNENAGAWQPLVAEVTASTGGIRSAYGAAPFAAIKNRQTGRGAVFHLLAEYAWSISVRCVPKDGELAEAEVEIGVNSENFMYGLESGKSIKTPEIIFYEFTNDIDLDCRKMHNYMIKNYKRKRMPVVYNTWLCRFDGVSFENIDNQIEKAAKLGAEYFTVDAGWFGNAKDWWSKRGDWTENLENGYCGRLAELAENVRAYGMKFGLWFEIESASAGADILKERKDLFFESNGSFFLDFSNPEAREYIFGVLKTNIEKYKIEYIKFDFNQDTDFDDKHSAYMDYMVGYRKFISDLREAFPDIYFENCASGGLRVDLRNCIDFDSFWLSDNQSPYEGMRIFKEGIKRLPPQCIEKWAVVRSIVTNCCGSDECEKIISTNDATIANVVGTSQSFLNGFLSGGPIGISCDLNALSEKLFNDLAEHISKFKKERTFWENAVCGILADTDKVLVLEYRAFDKIKIIAYTYKTMQADIYVYPTVCENDVYVCGGEEISGKDIIENGIKINLDGNFGAAFFEAERR